MFKPGDLGFDQRRAVANQAHVADGRHIADPLTHNDDDPAAPGLSIAPIRTTPSRRPRTRMPDRRDARAELRRLDGHAELFVEEVEH